MFVSKVALAPKPVPASIFKKIIITCEKRRMIKIELTTACIITLCLKFNLKLKNKNKKENLHIYLISNFKENYFHYPNSI